ncbi:molybdopterin molybdenumtransferase MoeA [Sulfolobus sp. S-194]|uniref:molybdopterin-binding protein n=1 Tax=Sulfolobus sp. S-194 TaxID=2512240 RepID=UPI0014371F8D|nr:molybdopterin-binding protein [Sulfolobus sp. S-194]QIW23368.1 molybdopterin molybdenumtransferase MoeA [Sulfolobus sp. S-194]
MRAILDDRNLLSAEDALRVFINETSPKPIGVEEVDILDSLNRISAEYVFSPINLPPFSRSTVDGYAIIDSETPGEFTIIDKISIGEYKEIEIKDKEAVEVDTGSIIPENATAVIKVEETERKGDKIFINRKVKFGENIGFIGSDIPKGFEILRPGEIIKAEKIALLASVGINRVKIFKRPKIYIITTGDELTEPGKPLQKGKIYESNSFYLYAKLKSEGYEIIGYTHVRDDKELIKEELLKGLDLADVVILTGGTSAGEKDFVHQVIKELGKIIVHGLKFKPGKPTILATVKGKAVIGLPGNIVSTIMITERVINKYLSIMAGKELTDEIKVKAILLNDVKADKNRYTYLPVYLFKKDEKYFALSIPFDSYMIGTFSMADGYIGLEPAEEHKEGEEVYVHLKRLDLRPTYIGEEEPTLLKLFSEFRKIPLGSYPALKALKYGIGDVIVISSLYDSSIAGEYMYRRKILQNGEGEKIVGYYDWIGLSRIVQNSSIKLRYPSLSSNFVGKATVIAPNTIINEGKEIGEEKLIIVCKDEYKSKLKTLS